jgi:NAD(P)-dependent dehydrogenase (short-subunit alcohol dehydrogenase family)
MKAVIIGGTSNIGCSIVEALSKENYQVEFTYTSNLAKANKLEKDFGAKSHKLDVRNESDVESLFNQIDNIDLLVVVSGVFSLSYQKDLEIDDFNKVIDINIKGTFLTIKHAIESMNNNSSIINIASINAFHPGFGQTAHYDASKGFIVSYTKSLAAELGSRKIRVNAIAPGLIEAEYLYQKDNPVRDMFIERAILKDTVKVEDISSTVSFLANNKAIDGQCIVVDCGYLIG